MKTLWNRAPQRGVWGRTSSVSSLPDFYEANEAIYLLVCSKIFVNMVFPQFFQWFCLFTPLDGSNSSSSLKWSYGKLKGLNFRSFGRKVVMMTIIEKQTMVTTKLTCIECLQCTRQHSKHFPCMCSCKTSYRTMKSILWMLFKANVLVIYYHIVNYPES